VLRDRARRAAGADPLKAMRKLWKHTRVNEGPIGSSKVDVKS